MKPVFCPYCGGAGFCQATCSVSTPRMQFFQRCRWQAQVMLSLAKSAERQQYWAAEVAKADRALTAQERKAA
jgi:hypothetical protein